MPTKLATAPTLRLPARSAAISRVTSKSSVWTRTVTASASRHRRKEGDLVAAPDGRGRLRHFVVDGDPQGPSGRELDRPRSAALAEYIEQSTHVGNGLR